MKTKLALTLAAAAVLAVTFAPAAQAKTIKLFVKPIFGVQDGCRVAGVTDQVKWSYTFKAKITRKNSPLPKNVIMRYSVLDQVTGATVVHQKITLKPKKFFKVGALTQYTAGHQLRLIVDSSFKSPTTGHTFKGHDEFSDSAPTVEQMDAANPPLPACA